MARKTLSAGLDSFDNELELLGTHAVGVAKQGLYEGAKVVADALSAQIDALQTEHSNKRYGTDQSKRLLWPAEKEALQRADHGIAAMREAGGSVDTVVGMAGSGYVTIHGREVPVPVIARSCDSGTSFMVKQPFMRRAISKTRYACPEAIKATIDKRFKELIGGSK